MSTSHSPLRIVYSSLLFSFILAVFLWFMEAFTLYNWFSADCDGSFLNALFPYNDPSELLSRFIVSFTVITMGMVVGFVLQQINNSRILMNTTLDSIGDGVVTVDVEGRILRMNPVAEQLIGQSYDDAVYKNIIDIVHVISDNDDDTEEGNPLGNMIGSKEIVQRSDDFRLIGNSGEECYIELAASPMKSHSGFVAGTVLVFRDVTELKQADERERKLQEQLHQSQKMDAVGQLAGGVAHDFNNVLGAIVGAAELISFDKNLKPQSKNCLDMIINSSMRAGELTQKLLTFSRKSENSCTPVDVFNIVNDTADLLKQTINKKIQVVLENRASHSIICGNYTFLQNAFMNIGINASQAMGEGGILTFSLESVILDEIYCELSPFDIRVGHYVRVSITDTGCGISREILNRIFEPFFTTKEKGVGTGLGLAAVYGTVRDHGGAINVYSEEGNGTVFHIYLPLIPDKDHVPGKRDVTLNRQGTVLLVDDEEYIRLSTKKLLETMGFSVLTAENGQKGMDIYDIYKDTLDLVILDMVMPLVEGAEVYRSIRKGNRDIPIVIASGFYKNLHELFEGGDDRSRFLQKPFLSHDLERTMEELLNG